MLMMKSVRTAAPGTVKVAEIQRPAPGPRDLLVRVRACGICGTDAAFVQMGGMPLGPDGETASIPLGHEPADEVAGIGAEVTGLKTGDRVVVNTALRAAKWGARLVTVAVHKKPSPSTWARCCAAR
jgi:(R,R)-butanediol dehydrogenase/meso-butanediol dehydrogenase/diacetyl reductase